MRLEDWREWPSDRVRPLLEVQRARWRTALGWDADTLFDSVEQARASGQLPGLVVVDDRGAPVGWCYGTLQNGVLFIGALHGDKADIVRALLDAMIATPDASYARVYRCFVFPETNAVATALTRRRFEIEPFLYLSRPIPSAEICPRVPVRPWTSDDLPETARLMARAYAGTTGARWFAASGRLDEWAAYLAQLVRTPACGTWAPHESLAALGDGAVALPAALVATRLSPRTTHVAQVMVDPGRRRRGLAAALIGAAAERAAATGATHQTLLVAESNQPARSLYLRLGFTETARFLFAERARVTRAVSSGAPSSEEATRVPA